jgi:hypothetical protein
MHQKMHDASAARAEHFLSCSIWCINRISLKSHKTIFLYEQCIFTDIHNFIDDNFSFLEQVKSHGTYIPLLLDPWRANRGISDIPPGCPRLAIMSAMNTCRCDRWVHRLLNAVYFRWECYQPFSRLLRHPWKKGRFTIFCSGYHLKPNSVIILGLIFHII